MKRIALFAAVSLFSVWASASNEIHSPLSNGLNSAAVSNLPVEHYNYSQDLDVAKVIQITTGNTNSCGPISAHMIYQDSKGVEHNLEYTRLGEGCENG